MCRSFDSTAYAVSITSANVALPATTVASLNTFTAAQLGYLTEFTASVVTRLSAALAVILDLTGRLAGGCTTRRSRGLTVQMTSASVELSVTAQDGRPRYYETLQERKSRVFRETFELPLLRDLKR